MSPRRSACRGTSNSEPPSPRARVAFSSSIIAASSPGHVDEPSKTSPGGKPNSRRKATKSAVVSCGMATSNFRFPVVTKAASATPKSRKRAASCDEPHNHRSTPASISRAAGRNHCMRRKLRSESRALITITGTPRRFACWRCSGQRSPSVKITISGSIRRQARAETGQASTGKYPTPTTQGA